MSDDDPRHASGADQPAHDAIPEPPRASSHDALGDGWAGYFYPPMYRRETRPRLMTDDETKDVLRILKSLNLKEGYADKR